MDGSETSGAGTVTGADSGGDGDGGVGGGAGGMGGGAEQAALVPGPARGDAADDAAGKAAQSAEGSESGSGVEVAEAASGPPGAGPDRDAAGEAGVGLPGAGSGPGLGVGSRMIADVSEAASGLPRAGSGRSLGVVSHPIGEGLEPLQPVVPLLVIARDLVADLRAAFVIAWDGPPGRDLRLAGRAGVQAGSAAVVGWLAGVAVCLTVWLMSAPDTSGFDGPLRVAGQLWLVAHHAGVVAPAGRVALAPLGFTALCVLVLLHAAVGPLNRAAQVPYAALGSAVGYGGVAALIAVGAGTSQVRPDMAQAVVAAASFGAVVPSLPHWRRVVGLGFPEWTADAARAAASALALLLGAGALLFAGSFGVHAFLTRTATAATWPVGVADALGMFLLTLALFPNAVVWGTAYLTGSGFAVGTGTSVGPFGVRGGALPSFPLLAAVPAKNAFPYALAALVVPALAGVSIGMLVRHTRRTLKESIQTAAAAAGATALILGVLAALSGGPIAGGRMATLGPSGWRTAAATLLLLGVSASMVLVLPDLVRTVRGWSARRMLVAVRTQGAEAWGSVARTAVSVTPKWRKPDESELEGSEPEPEVESQPEPKPEPEPKADAQPEGEVETTFEVEPDQEPEAETELEADLEPGPKPAPEPEPEPEPKSEPDQP